MPKVQEINLSEVVNNIASSRSGNCPFLGWGCFQNIREMMFSVSPVQLLLGEFSFGNRFGNDWGIFTFGIFIEGENA